MGILNIPGIPNISINILNIPNIPGISPPPPTVVWVTPLSRGPSRPRISPNSSSPTACCTAAKCSKSFRLSGPACMAPRIRRAHHQHYQQPQRPHPHPERPPGFPPHRSPLILGYTPADFSRSFSRRRYGELRFQFSSFSKFHCSAVLILSN